MEDTRYYVTQWRRQAPGGVLKTVPSSVEDVQRWRNCCNRCRTELAELRFFVVRQRDSGDGEICWDSQAGKYGYGSIPINTIFSGDEHPFTSYFDVHQRYKFWLTAIWRNEEKSWKTMGNYGEICKHFGKICTKQCCHISRHKYPTCRGASTGGCWCGTMSSSKLWSCWNATIGLSEDWGCWWILIFLPSGNLT